MIAPVLTSCTQAAPCSYPRGGCLQGIWNPGGGSRCLAHRGSHSRHIGNVEELAPGLCLPQSL